MRSSTAVLLILLVAGCQRDTRSPAAPPTPAAATPTPAEAAKGLTAGHHFVELEHDGQTRTAEVYVPAHPAEGERPLVLLLHGGFGNGRHAMRAYEMPARAETHGFVLVAPDGFRRTWNAGECCGPSVRRNIDDVGYLRALVERVAVLTPIDRDRVYATGMSNGAAMAYRLACEAADVFAAVAPVAGLQTFAPCKPADPVALLHIHGSDDQNVPLAGGVGSAGVSGVDWPSLDSVATQWRRHNQCSDAPTESYRKGGTTCLRNVACADDTSVEICVVDGAGHTWPPFPPVLTRQPTSADLHASDAVAEFLLRHRR